jgi:ATP-dependent helicase/nuclease subunit B
MFHGVRVVAGPVRCGKTRRLLDEYRQVLAAGPWGSALWLSPNQQTAAAVREQILADGLRGCFQPNCLTFGQLAHRLLEQSPRQFRPIGPADQRWLLGELVDEALRRGELGYFAPIAASSGFLDLLSQFIHQLKRLEVWPEELAAACGRRPRPKDQELCRLYAAYQQRLTDHHLYDAEGQFWSARTLLKDGYAGLKEGHAGPLAHVRQVFVDGFVDFTRTEHETLEVLAERVESLSISLPLEIDGPRADLFARSAKTLAALRQRHADLAVERLESSDDAPAGIRHAQRNVFAGSHKLSASSQGQGIEIIAAADARGEIETIARAIKRLLIHGDGGAVRPGEIMVVFRTLNESADLVRQVFARFGIPTMVEARRSLASASVVGAIVAWLRLEVEDWPFRGLLAVLARSDFRPKWPEWRDGQAAAATDRMVRRLQIPSGRAALLGALQALARSESTDAKRAYALLRRLADALDQLPRSATLADWASALTPLAESLGVLHAEAPDDMAAWRQLVESMRAAHRVSVWVAGDDKPLSQSELLDRLQDLVRHVDLPVDGDGVGRVRVLSAEGARNLTAPYVFLAGLAEKAFPPPAREDCLHNEAESRRLVAAGLPWLTQTERAQHEMLLFYELISRATRKLFLSYPALDSAAQPLSPSPFVSAVEELFTKGAIGRVEHQDLSCVPAANDVACPRDLRVRAVASAIEGDPTVLAAYCRHSRGGGAAESLLEGLRITAARQRGAGFGPFEGMMSSPAARVALGARFAAEYCWSPSQLEQYARCPFQFFMQRVLGLEPLDERTLESDYLGRGQLMHRLLADLHRTLNRQERSPTSPAERSVEELDSAIETLLDALRERRQTAWAVDNGLLEIDLRRVATWLRKYHQQHAHYDDVESHRAAAMRPAHFEVSFGPTRRRRASEDATDDVDPHDALSCVEPFELDCGGQVVRFSGRIDRIDLGTIDGQMVFNIVDYKSGASTRTRPEAVADGTALQLPLYALAAERLLVAIDAVPLAASYWHVSDRGHQPTIEFHLHASGQLKLSPQWRALRDDLRHRIGALVSHVRGGQFPMSCTDEKCTSRCPYHTVCRVNQVRALGKSWVPAEQETS